MVSAMGVIQRKTDLFEHIVRLRRAEQDAPGNRDIVAVRSALEDELGETVSRRLAARILGVSHTALARWTKAGSLPLIHGSNGREEVPVAALLELFDAVTRQRESGERRRHVLEPVMSDRLDRGRRMRPGRLVSDESSDSGGHGRAERRSLAYHRALARSLRRPMIDDALHLVWKWRDQGRLDPRWADAWEEVLRKPVAEVKRQIAADTQFARDLRQNSPLAGMLSEPERQKIIRRVR
jgi:hypothetical protein